MLEPKAKVPGSGEAQGQEKKTRKQKVTIQRYKGLGEMNPEELWETTMDPRKARSKTSDNKDGADADKVFDILMGEDVFSRKDFHTVKRENDNLDIRCM